jgi:phage shock protein PspC (stress-responsive transcriptional regulator)
MKIILILLLAIYLFGFEFSFNIAEGENFHFSVGDTSETDDYFPVGGFEILMAGAVIYLLFQTRSTSRNDSPSLKELKRRRKGEQLAGICSGVAGFYEIPVWIPRAIFVLLAILDGIGLAIYIILWIFMPYDERLTAIEETKSNQAR